MSNITFWMDLKEQYVSLLAKSKGEICRIVQFKGAFCILVENLKKNVLKLSTECEEEALLRL